MATATHGCEGLDAEYLAWIEREVHFLQPAQEATLLDYFQEVEHMKHGWRVLIWLSRSGEVDTAQDARRIEALQALRGIAQISAVTIVAELGEVSRLRGRDS